MRILQNGMYIRVNNKTLAKSRGYLFAADFFENRRTLYARLHNIYLYGIIRVKYYYTLHTYSLNSLRNFKVLEEISRDNELAPPAKCSEINFIPAALRSKNIMYFGHGSKT